MAWLETLKKTAQGPARHDLTPEARAKACRELVQMSAMAAGAVTFAPLPFVDFVAITPLQAAMVMAVGRVHGRELSLKESKSVLVELASVCGAGLLARQVFATASKFLLPGLGGILSAPYAFAATWAMGQVAIKYFEDPEARDKLAKVFEDALAEGKRLFSREALDEFRRKRGAEVERFAREEAATPSATRAKKPASSRKPARAKPASKPKGKPSPKKASAAKRRPPRKKPVTPRPE